ncbi:WD40 repeat domain-containing protein [Microcoleus sp. FACHB-68]|uniref:WD40 repeat domain-containing protein n=1 Tax=Microcoleus sp. FACHB-68 TaxID=2692826 RepID=UPI00168789F9|nr:WD40 repeat domain-containing protein [Microcoleus sp. FACHB-68]MBD1937109.1 WD40 repeat domain-containing protein [Microcoleus sp. FACHB-68]
MEQWIKLLIEYAVPIFNTLMYMRNGQPLSTIHIELDEKHRQAQLMLEYLGNDSHVEDKNGQSFAKNLAKLGLEYSGEIQEFIQSASWAIQQNSQEYQQWRFAQEKAFQQQLATYNRETQIQLATERREIALKLPEVEKILDSWPLRLLPSQILKSHTGSGPIPLRIIVAPPNLERLAATFEDQLGQGPVIPNIEPNLAQGLREFLSEHYPLHSQIRPTEFLGGAWDSRRFQGESSIKALFGMLKSEPTLILESEIEGDFLNFRMAYWGLSQDNYCYETIVKLPYRHLIYESAKTRALKWKATRDKLLAMGKTFVEIDKLGGQNAINLKILEEEEELKQAGIDVSELSFAYQINSKDFEAVSQLLTSCHCLVAGWMADVHHLVYHDVSPRLPELLPHVFQEGANQQLLKQVMQAAVSSYQDVLKTLAYERPYWVPEMAVKLAKSLTQLPDKSWAKEQVEYSLTSWLEQRQLPQPAGVKALEAMKSAVAKEDREYLEQLKECLEALGDDQAVAQVENLLSGMASFTGKFNLEKLVLSHSVSGVSGRPTGIAISPDGQVFGGGVEKNIIGLWHLKTGQQTYQFTSHAGQVLTLTISPDGKILASSDKTEQRSHIYIWDLHSGKLLRTLFGHKKSIHALALSPDGETLASGSHKVKIWNLQTGEPVRTLFGHKEWVYSIAISSDGETLVSASADKTIKIWHPKTEQLRHTLRGHSGSVYSVAIAPDGETLVSAGADKTIKIWNLQTGQLVRTLSGHSGAVYSVAIAPDGETLVSAGADKTIKIWNLQTGKEYHTLAGHLDVVYSVAIAPDGKTLVSAGADKTIKIWGTIV